MKIIKLFQPELFAKQKDYILNMSIKVFLSGDDQWLVMTPKSMLEILWVW